MRLLCFFFFGGGVLWEGFLFQEGLTFHVFFHVRGLCRSKLDSIEPLYHCGDVLHRVLRLFRFTSQIPPFWGTSKDQTYLQAMRFLLIIAVLSLALENNKLLWLKTDLLHPFWDSYSCRGLSWSSKAFGMFGVFSLRDTFRSFTPKTKSKNPNKAFDRQPQIPPKCYKAPRYNKRYFTLDFDTHTFFYTHSEGSQKAAVAWEVNFGDSCVSFWQYWPLMIRAPSWIAKDLLKASAVTPFADIVDVRLPEADGFRRKILED